MFDRDLENPERDRGQTAGCVLRPGQHQPARTYSQNFADRLLSKANVAVVPGAAFGDDRTVRLSYATSIDVIKKGLDRFQDFCRTL